MRSANLVLAILAGAALAGLWWWWSARPVEVGLGTVTRGTAAEVVYATGVIEPEFWAEVTTVIRGRIVESCRCEGRDVERGTLLFRLDDTEMRAHIDELEARLTLAEAELERTTGLFERGVTTREKYDRALAEVSETAAALAAVESQRVELEIRAPLTGKVLRIEGEVGEVAMPGEGLAWVGQPRPLLVIAEVNEEDIPLVETGQRALIKADAFPGRRLEAEVASITPMGNPELKTYRVRLALPEDTPLLIGMSVDVNIVIRTVEGTLLAPAPALSGSRVQVVDEAGRVALRPVETGIRGAERVEILSGLSEGERVLSPARDDLAPGTPVTPAPEPGP